MKVIIIGCGRLGSGLAQTLAERDNVVTVVDKDPTAFERLGSKFEGETIQGVGIDRDVLIQAGIERTDGLAAVTSSDETNVVVGRMARQVFHVPRVVARLYDPRQAEIYARFGLQTICTTTWGIHRISELICHSRLDSVLTLGNVDLVEVEIPPLLIGKKVSDLTIPGELSVVAITRGSKSMLPTLGTLFCGGDLVHLAVTSAATDRLNAMLELA